jgi:hypothetical protein
VRTPPPTELSLGGTEVDLHVSETVAVALCAAAVICLALRFGWGVKASVDKKQWRFETKEQKRSPPERIERRDAPTSDDAS